MSDDGSDLKRDRIPPSGTVDRCVRRRVEYNEYEDDDNNAFDRNDDGFDAEMTKGMGDIDEMCDHTIKLFAQRHYRIDDDGIIHGKDSTIVGPVDIAAHIAWDSVERTAQYDSWCSTAQALFLIFITENALKVV